MRVDPLVIGSVAFPPPRRLGRPDSSSAHPVLPHLVNPNPERRLPGALGDIARSSSPAIQIALRPYSRPVAHIPLMITPRTAHTP